MNDQTDSQLLRAYAEHRSEPAFAEIVRRHVDFIHSAALRMVCDSHLAEDVTQGVFVALAKNAAQLTDCAVLSGWLHRTAQNIAAQTVRTDVRRRAREQEAAAMNALLATEPDALWANIAPQLDAALGELSEPDRDALLLRYFERKSAREMAQTLGTSEDAAQKRVSRAVERLREFFAKRGVTVGASGLVVAISANAVHAAPVGLAVTISTAAALAGTTIATTATATTIKTIAMTTLQKTLVTATLAVAVGTGIYEARQAAHTREENQTLQQQQAPMAEQIQQLQQERDEANNKLAALHDEDEQLRQSMAEIPKLRGQITRLQAIGQQPALSTTIRQEATDHFSQSVLALAGKAGQLNQQLEQMPDKRIPELQLLTENDWLDAARDANLLSDAGVRQALSKLRSLAKNRFSTFLNNALGKYLRDNNGQLPADPAQLKPYLDAPLDDSFLKRYKMLHTGSTNDVPNDAWVISEIAPVDRDYDSHLYIGLNHRSGSWGTGIKETGDPDESWATRR